MIQIGQGRVFSRVTLAALIAAGCSGKVERDEANGSAGAPPGGVLGNGGDSSTASVGGVANGKPVANGGSPSTSGVGGSWAGGFNAVIGGGAAGGAPVAGAPACAPSGAGGVSGAGVGGALPGVGGYGPACM